MCSQVALLVFILSLLFFFNVVAVLTRDDGLIFGIKNGCLPDQSQA